MILVPNLFSIVRGLTQPVAAGQKLMQGDSKSTKDSHFGFEPVPKSKF